MSRHANNSSSGGATADDASSSSLCRVSTLFDYTDPVSPHLAAERDGGYIASDTDVVEAIVEEIKSALLSDCASSSNTTSSSPTSGNLVLVEAAGGVLSPAPSGSLQADAFRPMRLSVLLVGDGKLGGIGATLSALESLRTRGYSVLGIALFAQGSSSFASVDGLGGGGRVGGRWCFKYGTLLDVDQMFRWATDA